MWGFDVVAPGRVRPADHREPRADDLAPGEAIIRFEAGALCGSDHSEFRERLLSEVTAAGERRAPLHEVVGIVQESASPELAMGTRVVGWAKDYHGLAELVLVSDRQVVPVPEGMSPTQAVLAQPLACVLTAVDRLGEPHDRVGVIGLGPIGLLFGAVLSAAGAPVVGVDVLDRTALGAAVGIGQVVHSGAAAWAAGLPDQDRPGIVVEAVGHQHDTVNDAILAVRPGGLVFAFGINDAPFYALDMHRLIRKRLTLMAGIAVDHRPYLERAIAHLQRHPGLARTLITDVVDVVDAQAAYDLATRPHGRTGKVVLVRR